MPDAPWTKKPQSRQKLPLLAGRLLLRRRQKAFALKLLARVLTLTADSLSLLARLFDGRLLVCFPHTHFTEDAFALKFLLQHPESLIDVVVANQYLHVNLSKSDVHWRWQGQ